MIEASTTSLFALEWSLTGVTLVLFFARLYLRLRIQRRSLIWSDLFIFLAWASYVAVSSLDLRLEQLGFYDRDVSMTLENFEVDVEQMAVAAKLWFSSNFPTFLCLYLSKLSLLTFYWDLFAADFPRIRWLLRVAFSVVVVFYITTLLVVVLVCIPTSRNWDPTDESCQEHASGTTNIISWVLHFSSDLMVFLIPLRVVAALNLTLLKKISVFITFALGSVNLTICVVRIVLFRCFFDQLSTTSAELLWATDLGVSVLIAMLVSLRPYLPYLTRAFSRREKVGQGQRPEKEQTASSTANEGLSTEYAFAHSVRYSAGEHTIVGSPKMSEV